MKSALSLALIGCLVTTALPVFAQEKTQTSVDRFGFVLAVPALSAEEDTARPVQSAALRSVTAQTQVPAAREGGHPYKWPGILMIGVGVYTMLSAPFRVEGDRFRNCRAHNAALGLTGGINGCEDTRDTNVALLGAGIGLAAGGVFLVQHHRAGSPEIEIGVRRFSVTERLRF